MAIVSVVLFWASAGLLGYVYWGYGAILRLVVALNRRRGQTGGFENGAWPSVTVLLTVHNEQDQIENRLTNLSEQVYPGQIKILVCSDGSDDATEEITARFRGPYSVRLIRTERLGKSGAQNIAMREIASDLVILTDAETRFDVKCVRELAATFSDKSVGCVTANLRFGEQPGVIARSQGLYWGYELTLRNLESRLGILAVTSGQAMALRRSLFRELPSFAGDDCIIPLDIVAQGYKVVHGSDALAYDIMESEQHTELRARVRMTMRNWTGTWQYPNLLNPFARPGYAFALWSHKLLRWLASASLVGMGVGSIGMLVTSTEVLPAYGFLIFLGAGAFGWWADRSGRSVPVAGTVYSFCLANVGFLIGLTRATLGHRITAYRSASKIR
jgi:cellulose synthase/poly-beta-1,6-N-acetylglucosamine synthase-like glycosyltransferase